MVEWWELKESELIRLLKIRKQRKKFKFVRPYSWRWEKLDESWRYPDGIDNKVRLQWKWMPPLPEPGYGSPRIVRHLHPCKKEIVWVYNPRDLFKLDPQIHCICIASTVGRKKRIEIIRLAEKFGFRVINPGKLPVVTPAREERPAEVTVEELEKALAEEEKKAAEEKKPEEELEELIKEVEEAEEAGKSAGEESKEQSSRT